jgi:hypothetical protein
MELRYIKQLQGRGKSVRSWDEFVPETLI